MKSEEKAAKSAAALSERFAVATKYRFIRTYCYLSAYPNNEKFFSREAMPKSGASNGSDLVIRLIFPVV